MMDMPQQRTLPWPSSAGKFPAAEEVGAGVCLALARISQCAPTARFTAWFKKCCFRVTLDLAKAAPAKGFRASSVTLI